MPADKKQQNLLRLLIILTTLFVCSQVMIMCIATHVMGVMDIARVAMGSKLFFSPAVIPPLLAFIAAQLLLYVFYVYLLWYITISLSEFFSLPKKYEALAGICFWIIAVFSILALNAYYVPHSLFTRAIRENLFANALTDEQIKYSVIAVVIINMMIAAFIILRLCIAFFSNQNRIRHGVFVSLVILLALFVVSPRFTFSEKVHANSNIEPNVFIVGFDAVRPDYLSFFDPSHVATPHFDNLLQSAIVFKEAYTPVARTMPSWMGILTARYPLHNTVRENCAYLGNTYAEETLPKLLKKAGYETIYATDDRRFNNIDKRFGFDRVIGPPGTVADYLIGTINDFPLSNLLVPTTIGKLLFPYSYANHSAPHTYDPDNFMEQIKTALNQRTNKPLFFAVHFNLSGWPFYWFNDGLYNGNGLNNYTNTITADDRLLGKFLALLKQQKLLNRAIFVLVSDHGMTMALPGDRVIKEDAYQGNKLEMKVKRTRYFNAEEVKLDPKQLKTQGNDVALIFSKETDPLFDLKNYGIDTSYGYGDDVLSLKQNRALLAIKTYGMSFDNPHQVAGPSILLDIAPTLLDLLHLPGLPKSEGISLKPYLLSKDRQLPNDRPIYLETAYSLSEIEQRDIVVTKVIEKSIYFFYINPNNGMVTLHPRLTELLLATKQRAIMQGDWLLAYFPVSERFSFVSDDANKKVDVKARSQPPYFVLVNLKSGAWTTEIDNPLVANSPYAQLKQQLFNFYGNEMAIYSGNESKNS